MNINSLTNPRAAFNERLDLIADISTRRLKEIIEAEAADRYITIPCNIGDSVWLLVKAYNFTSGLTYTKIEEDRVAEVRSNRFNPLWYVTDHSYSFTLAEIGKDVFLNYADAKKALERRYI